MKEYKISFIGAGKVSGALGLQLHKSGCKIQKIVSRTEKSGHALAWLFDSEWSVDFNFTAGEDLIIVAVPDDALPEVLKKIRCDSNCAVVHTAGSLGLDIFPQDLKHKGVFYPLQTFSEKREINFIGLPFFLESSDTKTSEMLGDITRRIGGKAHFVSTEQRRLLHLAAVFACNFTNHMLTAGKLVASRAGFPFEIIEPLINETVAKALETGPENSQTGPAVRFDEGTIKKHIDLLSFSPELQGIYKEVTESIKSFYKERP